MVMSVTKIFVNMNNKNFLSIENIELKKMMYCNYTKYLF